LFSKNCKIIKNHNFLIAGIITKPDMRFLIEFSVVCVRTIL